MKIGGFKTGHCYHKPYTRNIHKEPQPVVGRTHIYELLQLETVSILVRYSNTLTFSAHSNELVT